MARFAVASAACFEVTPPEDAPRKYPRIANRCGTPRQPARLAAAQIVVNGVPLAAHQHKRHARLRLQEIGDVEAIGDHLDRPHGHGGPVEYRRTGVEDYGLIGFDQACCHSADSPWQREAPGCALPRRDWAHRAPLHRRGSSAGSPGRRARAGRGESCPRRHGSGSPTR